MSETAVKTRLPEFHLPDVDLSNLDLGRLDIHEAVSKVDWPKVELPSIDVRRSISDAAAAIHLGRRSPRPRWPLAVGLAAAGVAAWAILTNVGLREMIVRRITEIRDRFADRMAQRDPVAFDATPTAPMQESPFRDPSEGSMADYPVGLGSSNGSTNGTTATALAGSERLA
jgi:hypothetical protein